MEETSLLIETTSAHLQSLAEASMKNVLWKKRSIYKIPAPVLAQNKGAFRPQTVSFGPYHHDADHLKPMEEHKQRALLYFLRRAGKPLQPFVKALNEVVHNLKDAYDQLDNSWQDDAKFLQLMMLDGCFILEILRFSSHDQDDYAADDPVFSSHGKLCTIPYIWRDMLMLENQLPLLVLHKLVAVESDGGKGEEYVNRLILNYCSPNTPVSRIGNCLHVLDLYRKVQLQEQPRKKKERLAMPARRYIDSNATVRSAAELDEAGIRLKRSRSKSFKDISFHRGVLKLPLIIVDDTTESVLLNLMAFERYHVGAGNDVTSYVFFMDSVIDNVRDVALLHSRGIIQNAVGSDEAVAKLFNSLSKDITVDPDSSLYHVHKQVSVYCGKPWNAWRANLIHTYFTNPWAVLSLLAALVLFALTIIQTVYTIMSYQPSEPASAVPMAPPPLPPPPPPPPMHPPRVSYHHHF